MFRPESPWSPGEYFSRELQAGRAPIWCLDAVFIAAPAIGVFWLMERKRANVGGAADGKTLHPEP
jgi:hypothetical protein